jgi:hypothetical protein
MSHEKIQMLREVFSEIDSNQEPRPSQVSARFSCGFFGDFDGIYW